MKNLKTNFDESKKNQICENWNMKVPSLYSIYFGYAYVQTKIQIYRMIGNFVRFQNMLLVSKKKCFYNDNILEIYTISIFFGGYMKTRRIYHAYVSIYYSTEEGRLFNVWRKKSLTSCA
jgi:hypothetical protein